MNRVAVCAILGTLGACSDPKVEAGAEDEWLRAARLVSLGEPAVEIGRSDIPDDDFVLPFVVGANDNEIFVLDHGPTELRAFAVRGSRSRVVARRGNGPGELRNPTSVLIARNTLFVWDGRVSRLLEFDSEQLRRDTRVGGLSGPGTTSSLLQVDRDGRLIVRVIQEVPVQGGGRSTLSGRIVKITVDGQVQDTLAVYERPSSTLLFNDGRTRVLAPGPPLGPFVLWDTVNASAIHIHSAERAAPHTVRVTLAREVRGEVVAMKSFQGSTSDIGAMLVDSLTARLRAAQAGVNGASNEIDVRAHLPRYHPAVGAAFIDDRRRIWLQLAPMSSDSLDWMVLDSTFTPKLQVRIPHSIRVDGVWRDTLWGVATADDVPVVRGYALPGM